MLGKVYGRICLTSDCWTLINADEYISLTANFVNKN